MPSESVCYPAKISHGHIENLIEKGIKTIYWCVSPQNQRAVKFYDKNGYQRNDMCKTLAKKYYDIDEINRYIWYVVEKQ